MLGIVVDSKLKKYLKPWEPYYNIGKSRHDHVRRDLISRNHVFSHALSVVGRVSAMMYIDKPSSWRACTHARDGLPLDLGDHATLEEAMRIVDERLLSVGYKLLSQEQVEKYLLLI